MHVTLVQVSVKPEYVAAFIDSTRANHEHSIREPGNLRFDILQSPDDPCQFLLYEAYQDIGHAHSHKQTDHYACWRDTVAEWMAEPRKGTVYKGLFPAGA